SLRTAIVVAAAGIPHRVGFDASRGAWLFHERVPRGPPRHAVGPQLTPKAALAARLTPPPLHRPPAARRRGPTAPPPPAAAGPRPHGRGPPPAAAPGSGWPTKPWPAAGFAAAARGLATAGARVLLVGGRGDVDVAARVASLAGPGVASCAGQTDLATSVALI